MDPQERLQHYHDEGKAAGLEVRFWAEGVLVLCVPGGKESEEKQPDLGIEEEATPKD